MLVTRMACARSARGLGCVYTRLENALARKREMQRTINRCHDCIHDVGSHGPVLITRMACARSARARMRVHASENALAHSVFINDNEAFVVVFGNVKRECSIKAPHGYNGVLLG